MTEGKGAYLFCFARADLLAQGQGSEGLKVGGVLLLHRSGDLVAVMSEVPISEFTGPEAEAHLNDLAWLAPRALHHEEVVEEVSRHSPVFPARFGIIFSSLDSVEALLSRHHDAIRTFLDRTAGAEEWGFKGFLDRKRAQEKLVEDELAGGNGAVLPSSPGARYLQERRLRAQADTKVRQWLEQTWKRLEDELSPRALEFRERKLIPSGSAENPGEMVLNLAFLVPKAGVEAFRAAAAQLGGELADWGLAFEISGPFPPYSFTPGLDEKPAGLEEQRE